MFLGASAWLIAIERPGSNSSTLVKAALAGRLEAVVDELVLTEVGRFLRRRHGRSFAWLYTEQIRRVARVVSAEGCEEAVRHVEGRLKPGDRFHVAAARAPKVNMLVGLDEDFEPFPEYLTPREAAKKLGLRVSPGEL